MKSKCNWCDAVKENPLGLCGECHRFPPTNNLGPKLALAELSEKLKALNVELKKAQEPIIKLIREVQKEQREVHADFLKENGLTNHSLSHWDCEHSPLGICVQDNDDCMFCCVFCGEPDERK